MSDLLTTWNDNKDRPAWVQRNRDDLSEATDLEIPRALDELHDWLPDYKATVTRKLSDTSSDETATSESTEEESTDSTEEETQ